MGKAIDYQLKISESIERFCRENPDYIYSKEDHCWYKYNGKYFEEANAKFEVVTAEIWEEDELKFNCHLETIRKTCKAKCCISTGMNNNAEMLLNTPNGIINLNYFLNENPLNILDVIQEHDKYQENHITMITGANYLPNAKKPEKFIEFAYTLCNHDKEMVEYLFSLMAYCLTGKKTKQYIFMLFGLGRNGKTVFFDFMEILMGTYFCKIPSEDFSTRTADDKALRKIYQNRFKRLAVLDELSEKYSMNIALVKRITGGDSLDKPTKYVATGTYYPEFKIIINTNFLPKVGSTQNVGIWERLRVLITRPPIKEEDRIDDFELILAEEKDEVLTYILNNYLQKALNDGLKKVPYRMALSLEYKRFQENPIDYFFDKIIKVSNHPLTKPQWVRSEYLYGEYTQFHLNTMNYFNKTLALSDINESNKLLVLKASQTAFSLTMSKLGGYKQEYNGREYWKNLFVYSERIWSDNGEKVAPEWLENLQQSVIKVNEDIFKAKRQADELLTPLVQTQAILNMSEKPVDHFEEPEPVDDVKFDNCDFLKKMAHAKCEALMLSTNPMLWAICKQINSSNNSGNAKNEDPKDEIPVEE